MMKTTLMLDIEYEPAVTDPDALASSNGQAAGGNGHQNGNGHAGRPRSNGRRATASQIRAIEAIAERQHLDLAGELRERYGVERPDDLSITEASQFIDAIKAPANGSGGRR